MEREAVASFVERATAAIEAAPAMAKRNTELRVVEPFLSTLGWDVRSPSVTAAYSAPNGTTVDYALCPGRTTGAFVMVSPAEDDLSEERRNDLVAAMRAAAVPRGLYTNGRRYALVALDGSGADAGDGGPGRSVEHVELALEALPARLEALDALSFDAVAAAVGTDRMAVAEALVAADRDAVDAVTERVVDVAREYGDDSVTDAVSDGSVDAVASDVRPIARRFLRAVVDELAPDGVDPKSEAAALGDAAVTGQDGAASSGHKDGAASPGQKDSAASPREEDSPASPGQTEHEKKGSTGESAGDDAPAGAREEVTDRSGVTSLSRASASEGASVDSEYVLRFFEDGRSVGAVGNPNIDAALAQGVQYLLEERGIGPRIQFPYAPTSDDRAFLHREPMHPDGTRMQSAIDIGGVYVETGRPVNDLQSAVEALAERGGLRVMFSGDWA
ncbi:hypothetical protein [Halorubellus salinus]|uniref:hypothetical protein n=1 Tax=Halorubellus salinus TaxID=755309 RepID=UPI001D0897A2|nr:hypothetical protein [Halorubellus salinus]